MFRLSFFIANRIESDQIILYISVQINHLEYKNMALNVVCFQREAQVCWGVQQQKEIFILNFEQPETITTEQLIDLGIEKIRERVNWESSINSDEVQFLSPISANQKVICQGANYVQHMIDSGIDPKQKNFNMFFTKSSASIHHPVGEIIKPKHVQLLDYEIELCLVIKQKIEHEIHITSSNLHEYVAGICIGNDVSARDIQIPETQFFKGKSYRTFCPLGPVLCLLEKDELHYLNALELTLKVNSQIRQQDSTRNMVFKPAETLSEMSQLINFAPGDVVMTGTPSGCALSIPSPILVKISALLPEQKKWELFIHKQKSNGRYLCVDDRLELNIRSADQHIDLGTQKHQIKF